MLSTTMKRTLLYGAIAALCFALLISPAQAQFGFSIGGGGGHGGGHPGGGGGWGGGGGGPPPQDKSTHWGVGVGPGGVGWGVNVPLGDSVRLGVGSGGPGYGPGYGPGPGPWHGYYPGYYHDYAYRPYYHYYPHHYYWGWNVYLDDDFYYRRSPEYYSTYEAPITATQEASGPPPVPTSEQVAQLSTEKLGQMIAEVAGIYEKELGQFSTGDTWVKYFKLSSIQELMGSKESSDEEKRVLMAQIYPKMESARDNSSYDQITGLWGFKTLRIAVREYQLPPLEREVHSLSVRVAALRESLDALSTGSGWIKYFELDYLAQVASNATSGDGEHLLKISKKFESAKKNPEYESITGVRGFEATRLTLLRLTAFTATQSKTPIPPQPEKKSDAPPPPTEEEK